VLSNDFDAGSFEEDSCRPPLARAEMHGGHTNGACEPARAGSHTLGPSVRCRTHLSGAMSEMQSHDCSPASVSTHGQSSLHNRQGARPRDKGALRKPDSPRPVRKQLAPLKMDTGDRLAAETLVGLSAQVCQHQYCPVLQFIACRPWGRR
jgi:hypothetical protein